MPAFAALTSFLFALAVAGFGTAGGDADRPNIVFMMSDDLGYGDLGYSGGKAETPHLDTMAASPHALLLTRYYSGAPVCSPTRGTVLTGRNHNRYCVWDANTAGGCRADFQCPETMPLPESEITVAELLKKEGYRTAAFGKWHLGDLKPIKGGNPKWPVSHPGTSGFDTWWVTERKIPTTSPNCACFDDSLCAYGHYGPRKIDNGCLNYYTTNGSTLDALDYPIIGDDSHFLLKQFESFLSEAVSLGKRFFVYLPFHTVHIPYIASEGYIEQYTAKGFDLNHTDYYGAITAMDDVVNGVRDLLKKYNSSNNTMVWFTSDNGPEVKTPGVTDGFRGRKRELYEGGIRVPGIIEWPAAVKSNRRSNYSVVSSDFLPTVCDILGVSPPIDRPIDGVSILPLIRGESAQRNKSIAWMYPVRNGNFDGHYKFALSGDQYKIYGEYEKGKMATTNLFDLASDPYETEDIAGEHPELVAAMQTELETWRQSVMKSAGEEVQCLGYSLQPHCKCDG